MRTFEISFLPFDNIPWSEGYTCFLTTKFDWIIRIVVGNFAFRIGKKDDHTFFKSQAPTYLHSDITSNSYGMFIFPDGIRHCKMSSEICSCFLGDFWNAHRKPDPNMSDITCYYLQSETSYLVHGYTCFSHLSCCFCKKYLQEWAAGF